MQKLRTAVLGASGYTGAEAVRLILGHPNLTLTALTANRHAGKAYSEVYPHMAHQGLPDLQDWQEVNWQEIDAVFACLPHGASEDTIAAIARPGLKIVDLSADFRLKDADVYAKTYGRDHTTADALDYIAVWNMSMLIPPEMMEAMMAGKDKRAGKFSDLPKKVG